MSESLTSSTPSRKITEAEEREWPREKVAFDVGGYCEYSGWEIRLDSMEWLGSPEATARGCPHVSEYLDVEHKRSNGEIYFSRQAIVPRVVVAHNEGGYNMTSVCLDCILEAAATLTAKK